MSPFPFVPDNAGEVGRELSMIKPALTVLYGRVDRAYRCTLSAPFTKLGPISVSRAALVNASLFHPSTPTCICYSSLPMQIAVAATSPGLTRRLTLLTLLSAVGGALFVPFVIAGSGALDRSALFELWTLLPLGAAIVGALCAWGGLVAADRAGLPMPILRGWEGGLAPQPAQWRNVLLFPVIAGPVIAILALIGAHAIGLPKNPGDLAARLLTIPFAAVVTEVLAHLLILSAIVLWLKSRWLAILLSSVVFTAAFHGQSIGPLSFTLFALAFNFIFATVSGWTYTRYGFLSAVLLHAIAHGIVLGVN